MNYSEEILSLKKANIIFIKDFYTQMEADAIYKILSDNIEWTQKEYEGRKTALYGTAEEYKYALNVGANVGIPTNWDIIPILKDISEKVSLYTNTNYDVCLANYYKDGDEKFNFHADKEEIGKVSPICSLSFGAERKFYFRSISDVNIEKEQTSILLNHGSLLIMPSICHEHYVHALPRDHKIKTPRINLTFRKTKN